MKAKIRILFACGVLMIILPFTGFPDGWKTIFELLIGLFTCLTAYFIHRQLLGKMSKKMGVTTVTEAFSENGINRV